MFCDTELLGLSDEQLAIKAKTDNNATELLFEKYRQMINSITRSYFLSDGGQDDLFSEGMIGFFKAINYFNGKSSFKSFSYNCVKDAIITAVRKSNSKKNLPLKNYISFSGYVDDDQDKNGFMTAFNGDPVETVIGRESAKELIENIKNALSKLEFNILVLYLKGYSYREISEKTNKNAKAIDNALQRIRKKIGAVIDSKNI